MYYIFCGFDDNYGHLNGVQVGDFLRGLVPVVDHALVEALVETGGQFRAVRENGHPCAQFEHEYNRQKCAILKKINK